MYDHCSITLTSISEDLQKLVNQKSAVEIQLLQIAFQILESWLSIKRALIPAFSPLLFVHDYQVPLLLFEHDYQVTEYELQL